MRLALVKAKLAGRAMATLWVLEWEVQRLVMV